jgi:hypothetical protein
MHPTTAAIYGLKPSPIPHWEHWSCPDAETYLTGIDYYDHPRACRQRLAELYPQLALGVPETDDPKPRPHLGGQLGSETNEQGRHQVRWGDGASVWHDVKTFATVEEALAFSPLAQGDFSKFSVVESADFSSEEIIYQRYRKNYPIEWGDKPSAQDNSFLAVGFYNTMFMWPLLTFNWELFLECCLDERFERVMDEFAEINRRVFRAFARLPVSVVICHDDIVTSRGPVCSPAWMHKYIFPHYEEFWSTVKAAGKKVVFMVDGNIDQYAADVFACGADGIITEPHTDFKMLAAKHPDKWFAGEGDNRVLSRNNPAEIKAMVDSMVATARRANGYNMCIGNHIPWNVPPAAIKLYLDYAAQVAR